MTKTKNILAKVEISEDVLIEFAYLDNQLKLKSYPFYSRSRLISFQKKHDLRFTKHMGQNFLIDRNTAFKIVDQIPCGDVLEIGPGLGSLTIPYILLNQKKENFHFTSVELDPFFAGLHRSLIHNAKDIGSNIINIQSDFLEWDEQDQETNYDCIFGNLPYSISSPLLNYISEKFPSLKLGIFMLQKDFIDRLFEGSRLSRDIKKDKREASRTFASSLALKLNLYGFWKREFTVSSSCFFPRPKVDSAIISYHPNQYRDFINNQDKEIIPVLGRALYWGKRKNISGIFKKSPYFHPKTKKDIQKYKLEQKIAHIIQKLQLDINNNTASQNTSNEPDTNEESKLSAKQILEKSNPANMDLLTQTNFKDYTNFKQFFQMISALRPQDMRFIDWIFLSRFLQEHGIE